MPSSRPLAGHHAVVTGGGRGIGAAIADRLARHGANLTLMGRMQAPLDAHAEVVAKRHGVEVAAVRCDVADAASVTEAFRVARETFGPPQVLVCNAGQAAAGGFQDTSREVWDRMLTVNLTGTWLCIREVLPAMREAKLGRIVCIASMTAVKGYQKTSAYAASKAGVLGLVRSLAIETAKHGITVNAVCPGYTDTDMAAVAQENIVRALGKTPEEARAMIVKTIPRGTIIEPAEVADAVGWLCASGASAITGQTIMVAGGEVM